MPTERAMLEAALDRLAVRLRALAGSMSRTDALEAYLDLARPLVDECSPRDRLWVNARVEDIWSDCTQMPQCSVRAARKSVPMAGQRSPNRVVARLASLFSASDDHPHVTDAGATPRRH